MFSDPVLKRPKSSGSGRIRIHNTDYVLEQEVKGWISVERGRSKMGWNGYRPSKRLAWIPAGGVDIWIFQRKFMWMLKQKIRYNDVINNNLLFFYFSKELIY
jgi:hypothetical protein